VRAVGQRGAGEDAGTFARTDGFRRRVAGRDFVDDPKRHPRRGTVRRPDGVPVHRRLGEGRRIAVGGNVLRENGTDDGRAPYRRERPGVPEDDVERGGNVQHSYFASAFVNGNAASRTVPSFWCRPT